MPKKRAIMLVTWFGEHANIIMTGLAFCVVGFGIWSIYQYTVLRDAQSSLSGIQIARIVEERAANASRVRECKSSIAFVVTANTLISSYRQDLIERATANEILIKSSPDAKTKAVRVKAAKLAREKASKLTDFPERTLADCKELERLQDAGLREKYGDKLDELEEAERRSRSEDSDAR
jgi:hypothetical protein